MANRRAEMTKYTFGLPLWVWILVFCWCALNLLVGQWAVIVAFLPIFGFCIWKGKHHD